MNRELLSTDKGKTEDEQPSKVIEDIIDKFREGEWKEVLGKESIGGNAGPNRSAVNEFIDRETGRIAIFGNVQDLPEEITSNPDYIEASFIYNYGNSFERIANKNIDIDIEPEFFEKVIAPGASKEALENLRRALVIFGQRYIDSQKGS